MNHRDKEETFKKGRTEMKKTSAMTAIMLPLLVLSLIFYLFPTDSFAGSKPDKLVMAIITDMTGPYAPALGPMYAGAVDASQYVNDTGGIRGVPLEVIARDAKGKVDLGINHYMELREMKPRPHLLFLIFSPLGEALRERIKEDQFPTLSSASLPVLYPPGYTFGMTTTFADQAGAFIDWLAENWKEDRPPRLAFLTWDTTFGRDCLHPEVYAHAKKRGVEIVATELFGIRDVSVTTQLTRIRAKKADWIYNQTLGHGPVLIARTIKEMGMKVGLAGGLGNEYACLNIDAKSMQGTYAVHDVSAWSEQNVKGVQLIEKYFVKNKRPEGYRTTVLMLSWNTTLIFKEVVERIVDKYGWEKVTGPMIKKEIQELEDFKPLGLGNFTYSNERRTPFKGRIMKVIGKDYFPVTKWRNFPDLRPAKYR